MEEEHLSKGSQKNISAWSRVSDEVSQGPSLRTPLIKKIEDDLDAKVILYFTSFTDPKAMVSDNDAEMIENILSAEHKSGKIVLILNSAGGSGEAAERIVNVCRAFSDNNFEVIVPHAAKSAATFICFGASSIRMIKTAELGPVDPQVQYLNDAGQPMWISADEYVSSYEELINRATSSETARVEVLAQQLARYDSRYIEYLKSAQSLSENISIKLLQNGMMSKLSEDEIKEKISGFLIHKKTSSHGRMITMAEAQKIGLNISEISLRSDLWNWVWELFIRADYVVSVRARKILETSETATHV